MKIAIIGAGYVGLVQGAVLSEFGFNVFIIDANTDKINALQNNQIPIYEVGLAEMLNKNRDFINYTTDIGSAISNSQVVFIAVGTPIGGDYSADISQVINVADSIGHNLNEYKVIVNKSTVPVGTGELVRQRIAQILEDNNLDVEFDIVSNPEFLKEGSALFDCLNPDRIVIGTNSEKAKLIMNQLYANLINNGTKCIYTDIQSAELIKYAANSFLAMKISFINEIGLLAEKVGANILDVAEGIGLDKRISPYFLQPGPGYGGSCFPKDTYALVRSARLYNEELFLVDATIKANEKHMLRMVMKIENVLNNSINNLTIAILGLTFKANTDDVRDSPALIIITELIKKNAKIKTYCPMGMVNAQLYLGNYNNSIIYCHDEYECAEDASAVVILTEWERFLNIDLNKLVQNMRLNNFIDLRNLFFNNAEVRSIFKYYPLGVVNSDLKVNHG